MCRVVLGWCSSLKMWGLVEVGQSLTGRVPVAHWTSTRRSLVLSPIDLYSNLLTTLPELSRAKICGKCLFYQNLIAITVEPCYNEVLGTIKITLLYQVSHYIRVRKQRNIKNWDQKDYLVIKGFSYIRPLYNEVPLYQVNSVETAILFVCFSCYFTS